MTTRQVRALRGGAAAGVAVLVAAAAHTLAGGGAPSPVFVAVLVALSWPLAVALIGRRVSAWRIAATVLAAQALFHVSFALTASVDPSAAVSGHIHHGVTSLSSGSASIVVDAPMALGHLLAAAVTVVLVLQGERMLRAIARGIRALLPVITTIVAPDPRAPLVFSPASAPRPRARVALSDLSRRGPPSVLAAR